MLIEQDTVKHYCLVKSISRLLSSQITNGKRKDYFCLRYLNPFNNQEALDNHKEYCSKYESVKIQLPKKETMVKFKNHHRSEKVPFIIYADFECLNKSIQTCVPDPESSYTKRYQKHEPNSFYYYIKCFNNEVFAPIERKHTGKDAVKVFVEMLEKDIKMINNIPMKEMIFTDEDMNNFYEANICWICKEEFDDTPNKNGYRKNGKVRDHCKFTGKYRGAAHNICNLKYRKPNFTPVVFHNLSGYDSHLFIKNLGFIVGDINCIPHNEEKYISFSKKIQVGSYMKKVKNDKGETEEKEIKLTHTIRFIDSYKFMAASLDSLVNNLPKDDFINLGLCYSGDKFNLLTKKGVYPYDYIDSFEKLKETKLPPKEEFYSRLDGENISDEDYIHAQKVWEAF